MEDLCRQEIQEFHAWFQAWFRGQSEVHDRPEKVLADDFVMITPGAQMVNRDSLLTILDQAKASRQPDFTIEIKEFSPIRVWEDHALIRYQEWQQEGEEPARGRVSTALFALSPSAPCGVQWHYLQETWL